MLAKKSPKNQITLPKKIADQFPGAVYFEVRAEGDAIVLRPVEIDALPRVQRKLQELHIEESDIRDAVAFARRRGSSG